MIPWHGVTVETSGGPRNTALSGSPNFPMGKLLIAKVKLKMLTRTLLRENLTPEARRYGSYSYVRDLTVFPACSSVHV